MNTLTKMNEKNTKKQILIEHEKALKIIEELKVSSPKKTTSQSTLVPKSRNVNKASTIEEMVKYFNEFSNNLKEEMSIKNSVIEELKEKIETKKETIKNIYMSSPDVTIDELIKTYSNLLQEQENNLTSEKKNSSNKLETIKNNFDEEKEEHSSLHKTKIDEFNLSSARTNKEDAYNKEKNINKLQKEREEFKVKNLTAIEDLKDSYNLKWSEVYKKLEEDTKLQNSAIQKAEELKDKIEESVNAKVVNIVGRQKGNNTQEFRNIEQEYKNKIKLKDTQLENLEQEESTLDNQISELQSELAIVQEKAHVLATKTIESKSTTHSFQAMKDIAMEQAKGKK